jgi:phosphoserine aminotransferase
MEYYFSKIPDALIAVDATSSMAGVELDWQSADIWFASVQKCFGLPAGMAVMVCSPRALQYAE